MRLFPYIDCIFQGYQGLDSFHARKSVKASITFGAFSVTDQLKFGLRNSTLPPLIELESDTSLNLHAKRVTVPHQRETLNWPFTPPSTLMPATSPQLSSFLSTRYPSYQIGKIRESLLQLQRTALGQKRRTVDLEKWTGNDNVTQLVPKPSKASSFCCICRCLFEDYLTVISP